MQVFFMPVIRLPLIEISITSCGGIIIMYYSYQTTLKHLIESCVNTQTGAGLD